MMDDANNPYRQTFDEPVHTDRPKSNVLAIVGFVLAFCLPPIGLLLSVIAVFRAPRAFAIAGIIVGLIGSALVAMMVVGIALYAPIMKAGVEVMTDGEKVRSAIVGYAASNNDTAPPNLAALQLPREFTQDPWGNAYVSTPGTGDAWTLTSMGPDGAAGTADDFTLTSAMSDDDVVETFSEWMEFQMRSAASGKKP